MGRPERHDVDYFPFFAKRWKTLNILQSKYGLEGIGFFTNLMRFLALTPDHYYCVEEEYDRLNLFAEIGIQDEERGIAMIELMVKTEKLDRDLWENHKVIVCPAFIESIEDAYKRRGNQIITIEEIRLKFQNSDINADTAGLLSDYDSNNPVDPVENPENNDSNPQIIVKETKLKKSKVNQEKSDPDFSEPKENSISEPQKLFLHIWQHTPDVFNAMSRIESPKEWANFWEKSGVTCKQVQTALDNLIADVRCGAQDPHFVPATPDRLALKGWITKCQKRIQSRTAPPPGTSPPPSQAAKKSL